MIKESSGRMRGNAKLRFLNYCRASQTGDAIRAVYSNVGVGVVYVPCWCAGAEHNLMFLIYRRL